jgi:hypothetical protein
MVSSSCGKTRYTSRAKANHALALIRHSGEQRDKKPTRSYLCEFCHGWHLTSQAR